MIASLACAFLWPVAGHADGVDIPEVGVRILAAPSGSGMPELLRRYDGYLARLPIGNATLTVARLEDPVPPGSDVRDATYRATLQKEFNEDPDPNSLGKATVVAGHEAWTSINARRSGHNSSINYACITYVIVDQHLYRLLATAEGSETRPPDFDAAVHAISELTFGPIDRSALESSGAGSRRPVRWELPSCKDNSGDDYYPSAAIRQEIQGSVLVEFSIGRRGITTGLSITKSTPRGRFDQSVRKLVGNLRCTVPDKWQSSGAADHRFRMDVRFRLQGSLPVEATLPYPDAPDVKIVITAQPFRH